MAKQKKKFDWEEFSRGDVAVHLKTEKEAPCRMIAPFIEQIADEHPEYVIAKIDVDEEPDLAQAFGIQSIPTLVVIKNGEVVNTAMGAHPKDAILALLQ